MLSRIESLAHVLAWARYDEGRDLSTPAAVTQSELIIVTLPRLKLTFQARVVRSNPQCPPPLLNSL